MNMVGSELVFSSGFLLTGMFSEKQVRLQLSRWV